MVKSLISAGIAAVALFVAGSAGALTIGGEFWDVSRVSSRSDVDRIMSGMATATFRSSGIDYPNGSATIVNDSWTTLEEFLGADAATLSAARSVSLTGSIFRFTGAFFSDGSDQVFKVGSDDGFFLRIDGTEVAQHNQVRSFQTTTTGPIALARGTHSFELVYWENTGYTGVEAYRNGAIITGASAALNAIPLPASLPLLAAGFGGLVLLRRRKPARATE